MSVSIYGFVFFLGRRLSLRKSMQPSRKIEVGQHAIIKLFLRCHIFSYKSFFVLAMTKRKEKRNKENAYKKLDANMILGILIALCCVFVVRHARQA